MGTSSDFVKKLPKYCHNLEFNSTQLQSAVSDKCGQFAICYVLLRAFNLDLSFDDCVNSFFSKDTTINEEKVLDFINHE